jgi:hypothetical protein
MENFASNVAGTVLSNVVNKVCSGTGISFLNSFACCRNVSVTSWQL